MDEPTVREATPKEETTARSVLDAAMLEVDRETFERSLLLVATVENRLLGALLLDGREVDSVAVRPGRRGQGIGTALIEAAAARRAELTAGFDPAVRPFYEALGFEITCDERHCRGRLR